MGMDWDENLCVGLFYEHRFAMLISEYVREDFKFYFADFVRKDIFHYTETPSYAYSVFDVLLASQSDAHTIAPHRDPIPYPSTYSSKARKTHDVIYF